MAVELLTVVTHPDNPLQTYLPGSLFRGLAVRHRIDVVKEQLHQLEQKRIFSLAITYWHRSMSMALR